MNEAQLYVVRIWRQLSGFRAAVRRVDSDETQLFSAPEQVARYLAESGDAARQESNDTPPKDDGGKRR
jgi:hypothetical protein